jgi:hypothetical protein
MKRPRRDGLSADCDGVRVVHDERKGLRGVPLIAIVASTLLAAFLLLLRVGPSTPPAGPEPGKRVAVAIPMRAGGLDAVAEKIPVLPPRRASVVRRPAVEVARTSRAAELDRVTDEKSHPDVEARDYIAALRESGETAGLAAFPLPGTRPPRAGVIVPADYELPEGFARHYQATDDGRQLDPVLVVAPGYEIVDDADEAIALTEGRIVPPEYAPPDLPVQMLEVPPEHQQGEDAR